MIYNNDTLLAFLRAIDSSELVRFDEDSATVFIWNGGHTVNVWTVADLPSITLYRNVDVFSVGDFARNTAEAHEVLAAISDYLKGGD